MEQWKGKVAVVTGASSGIGEEITVQLIQNGVKVVGLGRRLERLNQLKVRLSNLAANFHGLQCDMTKDTDVINAFEWIKKNLGGVDILVNNAGCLRKGGLSDGNFEDWKLVYETNVLGLCIATREAIKSMNEKKSAGYIIHINSVAGHKVSPLGVKFNVYSSSKHAVTALSETLRLELSAKQSKIRVTSISPGLVRTEIFEASNFGKKFDEIFEKDRPVMETIDIANAVLYVLSTPPRVNVAELTLYPQGNSY